MNELELKEIFQLLEEQGWKPMLCDTPIPFFDNPVSCGVPTDIGDVDMSLEWCSREFMPSNRTFQVPAKGDSMRDANINAGDILTIETDTYIDDDDIVLAYIDGEWLVKAFHEEKEGVKWLVPFNDQYTPTMLTEDGNVRIAGKVIAVSKRYPRVKYRDAQNIINKSKEKERAKRVLSKEEVIEIINQVAPMVETGRQWFAVYCPLAHRKHTERGNYAYFCNLVTEAVPNHPKLPTPQEVQRMEVQSFTKSVSSWDEADAPVTGSRFKKYQDIGNKTIDFIMDLS